MWSIPSDKQSNTVYALSSVGLFVKSNKSEFMEKIFYFPSKNAIKTEQNFANVKNYNQISVWQKIW